MIAPLPDLLIDPVVRAALAEDLGRAGDITALACIDADARLEATFGARKAGTIAGLACARMAILAMDPEAKFKARVSDGDPVAAGDVIGSVGDSGGHNQPALYFEVRRGRVPVNPENWLQRR